MVESVKKDQMRDSVMPELSTVHVAGVDLKNEVVGERSRTFDCTISVLNLSV